ncbi:hypothetical protein CHLRE_09g387800v5 [Chlamydomonas reinhardtii]|uniref:Ferritin n=1 Tax=Chlamydomonas reinhardtii TaxID=3055 RepID=Q8LRU1_CHLRE|nr:uncharacterized protein CHLRE_09g387800v5 [Chlamydomonas reinhardtii]AAM27205.1 pre-apoferritin [Chlamydomonas reinhardtii]PNW78664.1 hypothetical protein CHLRE_09g387800v5 [Chlamydomonas reinhardtii]|eukprot:XP_001694533.1 pre-apoferritin [Chlamydomonas reinhardtii]
MALCARVFGAPAKLAKQQVITPRRTSAPRAVARHATVDKITGIVVQPAVQFSEVQSELATVDKTNQNIQSLARVDFHPACEAAINEQVNIEYNVSYLYHALWAYFDRDNVALPGLAAFFKAGSEEEREHAELLMEYQNRRGGRVVLGAISMPDLDLSASEKGDALYAMELALSLEKLNFQKLRQLHSVADEHGDASMADFVEGELLNEQVEAVKKVSEYVSQLRRVGQGLGVYQFDKQLAAEVAAGAAA